MSLFNAKFFYAEAKFTVAELDRTQQYSGEYLDVYLRRFHEKVLDCYDLVKEKVLVNVCLHGMAK